MEGNQPSLVPSAPLHDLARRLIATGEGRLVSGLLAAVQHVHALVAETRPSADEMRAVIDFLTEVGHSADARRQEWVLLADVLGVSTLVEDMNAQRPPGATPNTVAGPFYRADVPETANGASICRDGLGAPLRVTGRITDLAGAGLGPSLVEVWQANGAGVYENQEPDLQPEFNLRGRLVTDSLGRFSFQSVRPKGYRLPDDGPVGRVLTGLGLALERPAHLHFRVTAPGCQVLTTHVFDRSDPALARDAMFAVKPELLADITPDPDLAGAWRLNVTFVLAPLTGHTPQPTRGRI